MTAASGARDECLFELIFELHQVASAWPVDPRSDARRSAKSRIQAQDFLATKEATVHGRCRGCLQGRRPPTSSQPRSFAP
jgi:hypothetical protein